ncbi:ribosomal protein S6 kinase delta-1 [Elysia marginata]|uniref:Ribosomal protein S6 kinase delta-1 n=1 Tax=Elysia marginata TaxID=1093978 RepID=A0AAV4HMW9_9GAST|nr:ribosomal protein S6 kinase delta-1 [Elysia marginata]
MNKFQTFPIKAPETLTELICWKRYNDFKTLYKSLSALHKALHRRDAFPEFAKPKLFGRFDDDVIEERRQSAAALLNFVSTQPHLYKSLVFKQFLEDGKSPTNPNPKGLDILVAAGGSHPRSDGYPPPDLVPASAESCSTTKEGKEMAGDHDRMPTNDGGIDKESPSFSSSPAILKPTPVDPMTADEISSEPRTAVDSTDSCSNKPTDLAVLEGTWNYPAAADNISLNSSNGKDTTDTDDEVNDIGDDDVEEDSAVATSLPDTDLAFFDPMSHDTLAAQSPEELSGGIPRSNSWLLKGLNMCAEMETNESRTDAECGEEDFCNSGEQTIMSVGSTVTDGSEQIVSPSDKTSSGELSSDFEFIRTMSQSSDGSKVECGKGDLDLSSEWQIRSGSFTGQTTAVFSRGQLQPQHGDQAVEFGRQKVSRSSRSHSANSEKSQDASGGSGSNKSTPSRGSRSNLLRRLVSGVSSNKESSQMNTVKPRSATEHSVSSMDLGGTIDRVVLVRDKGTDETFVIKSIPKSTPDTERTQSILPTTCPHMVSLHRFFETDSCVFLLLQYASGGKLWTYIGDYLHTDRGNVGIEFSITKNHLEAKNIYSGTKVETDILSGGDTQPASGDVTDLGNKLEGGDQVKVKSSNGLGAVRFSELQGRRDFTSVVDSELVAPLSSPYQIDSEANENKNCHNSNQLDAELDSNSGIKELSRKESISEAESQDQFNDSGLESIPKSATKTPLNRRLSNLSDDMYVASPSEEAFSPLTPGFGETEEEGHFQKLLGETHHNIEDFSINSFDSGDVPVRINSSSSSCVDRIPSIPEDSDNMQGKINSNSETECLGNTLNDKDEDLVFAAVKDHGNDFVNRGIGENRRKILVARQISADQAFSHTYLSRQTEDVITEAKKRHASVDESSSFKSHHSVAMYAPTFNSDDLIRCSQDLLKQVDNVLSKTDTETANDAVLSPSSPATIEVYNVPLLSETREQKSEASSSGVCSVTKQPSGSSNESAEEPSIYDLNRSSDDDQDESSETEQITDSLPSSTAENSFTPSGEKFLDGSSNRPVDASSALEKVIPKSKLGLTGLESGKAASNHFTSNKVGSTSNARLSLSRIDSKELTRSASFECDLKSPTRNRARTVAAVFEHLDSTSSDHICIPESSIRKWTAQMVTAVSRLHSLGIVCRDLKPSNILLGEKGQLMLTYFCHLGYGDQELDWNAVDNVYAAPEVSSIAGYSNTCDWWSIGALLFELIVGKTLSDCHPGGITSHTCLYIPAFVSDEARSLLEGLLKHNPNERLGAGMAGAEEIKAHPFFTGVDWHELEYS